MAHFPPDSMAVDIFICRTAARDTERCASSCFLAPPALCLPESPVTNLYIRRSRCSTMLHSLHHWSKMKACKFKDVSPEPPWTVFCSTEWMQVWIFFWVSAVPFCMWVVVPTIWSNPRRERLIQGSGNSAVTQTESLPAAKQSLCSVSAVIQVFIVKVGRTEDMRVCQMPIQEFESSKEEKKKNPFRCQKMFCSSSPFVEKAETVQSLQRRDGSGRSGDESTSPQRGREDR